VPLPPQVNGDETDCVRVGGMRRLRRSVLSMVVIIVSVELNIRHWRPPCPIVHVGDYN